MSEKEFNRLIEDIVGYLIKGIGNFVISIFHGVKKLGRIVPAIFFLCSFLFSFIGVLGKDDILSLSFPIYVRYMIYWGLLFLPLFYLSALGSIKNKSQEKYKKMFIEIGFLQKNRKPPYFIGSYPDGKKVILIFKSIIPLQEWKRAIKSLESGLDCNITNIEEGKNKKITHVTTIPSSYEIPNKIMWNDEYIDPKDGVIVIGEGQIDKVQFNLNKTPHVLIGGETGSGKSVILRAIMRQMVLKGAKSYMFDFKGGIEFGKPYERFGEVVTEREQAVKVLDELVRENEYRMKMFRDVEAKNLKEYNDKTGKNLARIGVYCDEIAEMLDKKGASKKEKEIFEKLEGRLSTLARLSRATGINLFLGVQRPDANVLTGQIKNNIPIRISGRFADKSASEIVLGNSMAVDLPAIQGRFLFKLGNETKEFQAYYFDDDTMLTDVSNEPIEKGSNFTKKRVNNSNKSIASKEPIKERRKKKKESNNDGYAVPERRDRPVSYEENDIFDANIEWSVDAKNKEIVDLAISESDSDYDFNYDEYDER